MQYTSRAAVQYKAALEKDLAKVNSKAAELPSSPTAAQAANQGLDLLAATVSTFTQLQLFPCSHDGLRPYDRHTQCDSAETVSLVS